MNILITGFEHYGNTKTNPAQIVVEDLKDNMESLRQNHIVPKNAKIHTLIVPSNFWESIHVVVAEMKRVDADVVIMLGEYTGRAVITVERIATNINDAKRYGMADNNGVQLQGPTDPDGPLAYESTLPIRAMVQKMRRAGIPADISDVGGTFCCNHLHYGVLHHVESLRKELMPRKVPIVGWIHLPMLPETAALPENLGQPSMSAGTSLHGVLAGVQAIMECHNKDDDDEDIVIPSRLQI